MEWCNYEFLSLKENNTWTLSELPEVKKAIKTRWVFKIKHDSNNQPERFKARLVAKGYNQEYWLKWNICFSNKAKSIKLGLAIAVNEDFDVHQIDISTAGWRHSWMEI